MSTKKRSSVSKDAKSIKKLKLCKTNLSQDATQDLLASAIQTSELQSAFEDLTENQKHLSNWMIVDDDIEKEPKKLNTCEDVLIAPMTNKSFVEQQIEYIEIGNSKMVKYYINSGGNFKFDLRKFDNCGLPTERGITLDVNQFKELVNLSNTLLLLYSDAFDRRNEVDVRYPLSGCVYASLNFNSLYVDVRHFYVDVDFSLRPTRLGVAFNLDEFKLLISIMRTVELQMCTTATSSNNRQFV
jgi:hypothetical protein